jgi:hypothetical protein
MFMAATLIEEVLETLKTIEKGSPSASHTTEQALQVAHIKALIAIAEAIEKTRPNPVHLL